VRGDEKIREIPTDRAIYKKIQQMRFFNPGEAL
jgi:hypothetical protein